MDDSQNYMENLLGKVEDLVKTSIELARLKTVDKLSDVLSSALPGIILGVVVLFMILMLSIAASLYLGEITGQLWYGFLFTSGFYLIIIIILYLFRKPIKRQIGDSIIKKTLN
jgi:formate/nitrite transporter FocA (FNT family)